MSKDLLGLLSDVVPLAVCQALPLPCVLLSPLYFVPLLQILAFPAPRSRTHTAHRIATTGHQSAGHRTRAKDKGDPRVRETDADWNGGGRRDWGMP